MMTRQQVSGLGTVRVGGADVTCYFLHEYDSDFDGEALAPRDEDWRLRMTLTDEEQLQLLIGEPVRLAIPGESDADVCLKDCWMQPPFVWLEFEPAVALREED